MKPEHRAMARSIIDRARQHARDAFALKAKELPDVAGIIASKVLFGYGVATQDSIDTQLGATLNPDKIQKILAPHLQKSERDVNSLIYHYLATFEAHLAAELNAAPQNLQEHYRPMLEASQEQRVTDALSPLINDARSVAREAFHACCEESRKEADYKKKHAARECWESVSIAEKIVLGYGVDKKEGIDEKLYATANPKKISKILRPDLGKENKRVRELVGAYLFAFRSALRSELQNMPPEMEEVQKHLEEALGPDNFIDAILYRSPGKKGRGK